MCLIVPFPFSGGWRWVPGRRRRGMFRFLWFCTVSWCCVVLIILVFTVVVVEGGMQRCVASWLMLSFAQLSSPVLVLVRRSGMQQGAAPLVSPSVRFFVNMPVQSCCLGRRFDFHRFCTWFFLAFVIFWRHCFRRRPHLFGDCLKPVLAILFLCDLHVCYFCC